MRSTGHLLARGSRADARATPDGPLGLAMQDGKSPQVYTAERAKASEVPVEVAVGYDLVDRCALDQCVHASAGVRIARDAGQQPAVSASDGSSDCISHRPEVLRPGAAAREPHGPGSQPVRGGVRVSVGLSAGRPAPGLHQTLRSHPRVDGNASSRVRVLVGTTSSSHAVDASAKTRRPEASRRSSVAAR